MANDEWNEVKSKVEGLGLKLKLHIEQEDDDADEREPGSTRKAFEDLGERLEDAFEAFGNAAKDPAVRSDVQELGILLKDALRNTMSDVGAEIRQAGQRMRDASSSSSSATTDPESPLKDSPDDDTQDDVSDNG